jgi:hypothetical protein
MLLAIVICLAAAPALAQDAVPLGEVIEAESLVAVGAEAEQTHADTASGGAYVFLPETQMKNEKPNSWIEVPIADMRGIYRVRVRALALSGGTDSLRYGTEAPWSSIGLGTDYGEWRWYEFDMYEHSPEGVTTLLIGAREPARIDAIEVIRMKDAPCSPHQSSPMRPEPNACSPVDVNPPTFRWREQGDDVICSVQVARDVDFAEIVYEGESDASYLRPLEPLPDGEELHWRWRSDRWEDGAWSAPESFEIPSDLAEWPLPPWEESFARIPEGHPRVWMRPEELEALREWAAGDGVETIDRWRSRLNSELGKDLPLEDVKQKGEGLTREEGVIQRITFKGEAGRTAGQMQNLALMYALTGDESYAEEVRRRALLIAGLDARGYASHEVSDFGNGNLVEGMAWAYELTRDYLSDEELATIRDAIHERLAITAPTFHRLEQRLHNAHAWQHTMLQFMAGALAIADEVPEAAEWFRWGVKTTVALYPWFGGADGGSAEMANYFAGTNLHSSMQMRDLIYHATGIDLCDNPWYTNNVYYTIYAHPPNHHRSQFGDHGGGPMSSGLHRRAMLATRYRAALLDDPDAAAFAAAYATAGGVKLDSVASLLDTYRRLRPEIPEPRPLSQLPAARAFRDIGVVYLHTGIERPEDNVFLEFKSGPFGSHGHSHNDQNTFNLSAYNEPLLVDTGYYHSYGDAHHAGWTMRTKAHNGILFDGTGQPNSSLDAFGRLIAFEEGAEFMYTAGEAKWAYDEVEIDRFTRHILALKPDIYLVYDQIETPEAHTHHYLLHAESEMAIDEAAKTVDVVGREEARCRVTLVEPAGLAISQHHEFDPPALRWRDDRGFEMADQWHLTAQPAKAADTRRFLAVIEVGRRGDEPVAQVERLQGDGWLGVRIVREDGEIVAGFADELPTLDGDLPRVQMDFGSVSADGFAAAVELRGGESVRAVTIGGTGTSAP